MCLGGRVGRGKSRCKGRDCEHGGQHCGEAGVLVWAGGPSQAGGDRLWKACIKVGWTTRGGGLGRGLMSPAFSGCYPLEAGAWLHTGYGPNKLFEGRALIVTYLGVPAPASEARSLLTAPVAVTHRDCASGAGRRGC